MTEDKGRILLAGDETAAEIWKGFSWLIVGFVWILGAILVFAGVLFREVVPAYVGLMPGAMVILFGSVGAYLVSKMRLIRLHENGVDNLRHSWFSVRFAQFGEVGSADIWAKKDRATILFWVKDRRLKPFNPLYLRNEDIRSGSLKKVVEFLRSKSVKVNFSGEAESIIYGTGGEGNTGDPRVK